MENFFKIHNRRYKLEKIEKVKNQSRLSWADIFTLTVIFLGIAYLLVQSIVWITR